MRPAPLPQPHCTGLLPASSALADPTSAYGFNALQYEQDVALSKYEGKVMVVVNIASE